MICPHNFRREVARVAFISRGRTFVAFASIALVAGVLTTPSNAQNKYWVTTTGGSFGSSANWSTTPGTGSGAAPPAAGENANFTLTNTYTVSFGGDVINNGLSINSGVVTFDLNASDYIITGALTTTIGALSGSTGRLTVRDGILGVDSAGDRFVVAVGGATGSITLTTGGRLGDGTNDPDLIIGGGGNGTLTVEDNGRADLGFFNIGQEETATGTVTLRGPHAIVDGSGVVTLGVFGSGTLTIEQSATMNSAGAVTVGAALGSNGSAKVTGTGSTWSHGNTFILGSGGDGGLTIEAGGKVTTAGAVTIGQVASAFGGAIVTGTDSVWNMSGALSVGESGFGNFALTTGGQATTAGATTIAAGAGSEGNVVVTGAGSVWNAGGITVGSNGAGNFTVSAGGAVTASSSVVLGSAAAGAGTVRVSGAGSSLDISGALTVAGLGSGSLTVDGGAELSASGVLTIGDPAGGPNGTFNFHGGTVRAGGFTRSATSGFSWTDGTLFINGNTLNNGGQNLIVNGADSDDAPALRLAAGAQSLAANLPNLIVGADRQGLVVVSGGSSFQTTTTSVGSQDGGNGSLVVEGANSNLSTSGDLGVGGTTTTAGGLGTVTVGPGGTVTATGTLRLWDAGTINVSGGTLRFTNLAANGGRVNLASGAVQALTTLNANATVLNAILGPNHILGAGRRIEVPGNALNLQSNLTVDGGAVTANTLAVTAGVVAEVEAGGSMTFANGITNPAGARMYVTDATVGAGTTFTNGGELHLAGSTATVSATSLANTGLVSGSGRINNVVTNSGAGQIRVASGERLEILGSSGTNLNDGLIDVDGGAIEFARPVTNSTASPSTGLIVGRNATLRFQNGLTNNGAISFTAGVSDVFGDITNQNVLTSSGRIIVTGGAQANFYDDVTNSGQIQVSSAGSLQSTAVFLGNFTGPGSVGGGHVFLEGDTRPGFSPGTMSFGGDVSFGPQSTLEIEIAGIAPGTQYDRVSVVASANLGGTLEVTLLGGFKPALGSSFQILSAGGGAIATFDNAVLPELAGGLSWDVNYAPQSVSLAVGGVLGDYNRNGIVDLADYVVWRNQLGTNALAADGSGNGSVDQDDYNVWRSNFGAVAAASGGGSHAAAAAVVPEPAAVFLIGTFAMFTLGFVPIRFRRY